MEFANDTHFSHVGRDTRRGGVKWLGLAAWIGICFTAAASGALFAPGDWYAQLIRPSFAPPNYLFGPVWTVLYLCMAVSAWLVWKSDRLSMTWRPLAVFFIQLVSNAAWTWLFFGLRRMDLAFYDIVFLLAAIVATIMLFRRVSTVAAILLTPYLAWVTFASALNLEFWRLNT